MFIWNPEGLLFAICLIVGSVLTLGAAFGSPEEGSDADADHADSDGALDVGQPPLILRTAMALLTFGAVGVMLEILLQPGAHRPVLAVSIALATSWVVGRIVMRLFRRHLRLVETAVLRKREIVGSLGKAVLLVTSERGLAQVCDRRGDLHQIRCQARAADPAIAPGAPLLVVDYDEQRDVFDVVPRPEALDASG